MPTTFYALPRELRYTIFIEAFDVSEKTAFGEWTFGKIKTDMEEWTTVLQTVDDDVELQGNMEFATENCGKS